VSSYDPAMLSVHDIWRYPVKSLGGERLDHAEIGPNGVVGDRQWGIRDRSTGMVLTARREPALLMAAARLVDGAPVITTEEGAVLGDDEALSAWLGRPVELVAASSGPGTFENPMNVDDESDWVSWQSQEGSFHDGRSTVSLVSLASLAHHDRRRFRINLVLDGSGEDDLTGTDVRVGAAALRIRNPIPRCVMVNRAQPGLPADREVLKDVIRQRHNLMGVGAVVTEPGTVSIGDALSY
jgi:uncharacterized protein YcbX